MLGHELWFVRDPPGNDPGFLIEPLTLAYLGVALLVVAGVRAVAHVRDGVDLPHLARLAPWIPFALRLHVAVSLVGLLSAGAYLAPSLELPNSLTGWLLGTVMAATAVLLVTGYRARVGAALLLVSGPLGMLEFGVWPIVQRLDLLGLALFLLVAGPGRWSADHELGRVREPDDREVEQAIWALRVCVGAGLIAVALAEKLLDPALALHFLDSQGSDFNVLQTLGLPVGDVEFVRIAGALEVLFGLLLISGALPQAVVLAVGVPFNLTIYFFGTIELLGHLPIYGAMLALLVYGSHPRFRRACWALLPPLQREAGATTPSPARANSASVNS
jgi:uncharacterized membrane protein YphA (DoxX/SURF4 family)